MRGLGDLFGGTKSYIAERQADDDGRVLGGLRYVRNAAGHDRLVVVTHYLTAGLKIPFTLPARRAHLVMGGDPPTRYQRRTEAQRTGMRTFSSWKERCTTPSTRLNAG